MELDPEIAPRTVQNFVALAQSGFYDGLTFHRVEPGFVVQGGDGTEKGLSRPPFFDDEPVVGDYVEGAVAMANEFSPNTNSSEFFICLADLSGADGKFKLPKVYNLFGQVTDGMDVVLAIKAGDVMRSVTVDEMS